MESLVSWATLHWELVSSLMLLLVWLINAATRHWSDHEGIVRLLLFVTEILSPLTSKGVPGWFKWPLSSKGSLLVLVLALMLTACTTSATGERQFDPAKAMAAACAIAPPAVQLQKAICETLSGEARVKCLRAQAVVASSTALVLGLGSAVYGACTQ